MDLNWVSAERLDKWIPIEACKDGYLYLIAARNATLGIYRAEQKGFEIRREKMRTVYSYVEDHWDTGEPHGTAKPRAEIEKAPSFENEEEFISYMEMMFKKLTTNQG
jgi:hypothetical protein